MVNASPSQVKLLEELRGQVLDAMHSIEKVRSMRLSTLATIKLGVLRKNATQRHGVTRWQRSHAGELTVETVDLHPHLLNTHNLVASPQTAFLVDIHYCCSLPVIFCWARLSQGSIYPG